MKKFKYLFLIIITLQFVACNSNTPIKNKSDTTEIILEIFNPSSTLIKDLAINSTDTLFFLKSKRYYNQYWPNTIGKLKFVYIEEALKSRNFNKPGSCKIDIRKRFEFTTFDVKSDSAIVEITYFNSPTGYQFKLIKKRGFWKLKNVSYVLFNPIKRIG